MNSIFKNERRNHDFNADWGLNTVWFPTRSGQMPHARRLPPLEFTAEAALLCLIASWTG